MDMIFWRIRVLSGYPLRVVIQTKAFQASGHPQSCQDFPLGNKQLTVLFMSRSLYQILEKESNTDDAETMDSHG